MRLLEAISFPGSKLDGGLKTGTGDDRYAFDEAGGWACVIDGATDVGPVRLFSAAESDAARYAEIFAQEIMLRPADPRETPQAWFARLLPRLRAAVEREVKIPLAEAPLSSYPTAAATWLRSRRSALESATLGDTIAIVRTPAGVTAVLGEPGKSAEEHKRAQEIMAMGQAHRLAWLRDVRALHNTVTGYWVFGVQPEAASRIVYQVTPAPTGTRVLLMSDGFYRLVCPYNRFTEATLIDAAVTHGLGFLMNELRACESSPADDVRIGRFKTSDDATALLLEV